MANCKKWPNADCDQIQSVTKCRVWSNAECEQISVAQLLIGYPILPYFQAPHSYEVWGFSISHVCVCKDVHRYHFYGNNVRLEN